jgi:hypothetical protein
LPRGRRPKRSGSRRGAVGRRCAPTVGLRPGMVTATFYGLIEALLASGLPLRTRWALIDQRLLYDVERGGVEVF